VSCSTGGTPSPIVSSGKFVASGVASQMKDRAFFRDNYRPALDDLRWLVGPEARPWLDQLVNVHDPSVAQVANLRRSLPPERARLVLEQALLRRRAREKFSHADEMFFTAVALEQATDEQVAAYKASRFPHSQPLLDLCCGIGGDLSALAERGKLDAFDLDPATVLLAAANCPATHVEIGDACTAHVENYAAWHIDPDRRASGRRTTQLAGYQPPLAVLDELLARNASAAIKLAPATEPPPEWLAAAHREWISRDGQCRQLVAWFGALAFAPGGKSATVLRSSNSEPFTISIADGVATDPRVAERIGCYVFEPDAAVLAARLTGVLAARFELAAVAAGIGYLTADHPVDCPALQVFKVCEVLPLDVRRLKAWLRERGIGRLEVKKRGVDIEPESLRRRLNVGGDNAATLVITPHQGRIVAIIAQRVH
jgi:SAM-dependent methyltransferase